uniref:Uncharacterized protein n=1 Tax=Arundo donax TaxID=35708 RepID=A0A0A9HBY2_ARUDO
MLEWGHGSCIGVEVWICTGAIPNRISQEFSNPHPTKKRHKISQTRHMYGKKQKKDHKFLHYHNKGIHQRKLGVNK